ncbi:Non-specific serine/threonine protein kinase [Handroanthus impetiginosus]|uniref:Non-specific serine/threonine protein kinase n=1 Tax=Handroanthus impetiginosus TaxID=429701 RepID=A0A2G9HGD0_9LAMI|nr:Non-specific serine/threonine protein kinase [Handroanthus impetiginosus]
MSKNLLPGNIPEEISHLHRLRIDLTWKNFTGEVPKSWFSSLHRLEVLFLYENKLNGVIPNEIGNLGKLKDLRLQNNRSNGHIPAVIFNMSLLEFVSVRNNRNLPTTYNLPNFEELYLGNNNLKGQILDSVSNSSKLTTLELGFNQLSGLIPKSLSNLNRLWIFNLNGNNLTSDAGSSRELSFLASLMNCRYSQELLLSNNPLDGTFPPPIGNFSTSLRYIIADNCKINGSIPTLLSSNKLNSNIPEGLWSHGDLLWLDLSSNSLSGSLSPNIENLHAAVVIDLLGNLFSGSIPRSIGDLESLTGISLANNRFHGSIPKTMSNMLSFESLDLSRNNLSGVIPKSLETFMYLTYFNKLHISSFIMNKDLCGAPRFNVLPCRIKSSKRSKLLVVLVSLGAVVVTIATVVVLVLMKFIKKNQTQNLLDVFTPLRQRRISYYELQQATDGYDESILLGTRDYGTVHKGLLRDGSIVAVKVFNLQKSYKVICSCSNNSFKALALEYISKGSLASWLYSYNYFLDIMQRLDIMIDVASVLEYLHHGYSMPVIHCDLMPSNVLIDEDTIAHVSDFGMAKLSAGEDSITHTRTLAILGYMAPKTWPLFPYISNIGNICLEYGMEAIVSPKCDVYSYEIMLVDVFKRT